MTDSTGPIPSLIKRFGNIQDTHLTILVQIVLNKFPILLRIPNPATNIWKRIRFELGRVADDVWEKGIKEKRMESRILSTLG